MTPEHVRIFCPTCREYRGWSGLYVLMFGEVMCRVCDDWTGDFEHEL